MTFKPASFSTIQSVGLCLLHSIESENAPFLPAGFFNESPWESVKDLDFNELRACISKTLDLLKQQLFQVFALICRRRSSFLPVHRLPPEILSVSIAHSMAEIECHNHQQRLIQLSTVSWWWRQVTLGTPSLWSVICSKDPEWIVSLALERSKDAPLTILYDGTSYSSNLHGGKSNRESMGSDDFLRLVSPHTARWADATVPQLGSGHDNVEWLSQHPIQLSQHLRQLNLDWHGSPSTDNAVTRFSGRTGCLLDLKLRNLHIVPTDMFRILAAARRMVSLDLDSLVASVRQEHEDEPNNTSPPMIDLPCLKRLALKGLPSNIMDPIVQHLNPSALDMVSIDHNLVVQGDPSIPSTHPDPFASFTARLVATRTWTEIQIQSNGISLKPCAGPIRNFAIRLEGERVAILWWLRLRSLPQITREYSLQLDISSDSLGENPEQMLIDNLMRFSNVGSVVLWGRRESQRWIWLLSLPDAVQADLVDSKSDKPIRSWLWPGLCYLRFKGDYVNEFTILSVLLARYGSRPTEGAGAPSRFVRLDIRPGENVWRAEVFDRIKKLVGPSCAVKWVKPQ